MNPLSLPPNPQIHHLLWQVAVSLSLLLRQVVRGGDHDRSLLL